MMRTSLLALAVALAAVGCGSAPSSDPASQLPVQSSPAASASAVVSSGSAPSVQFAGRLTFPASTDWTEKVESGDPTEMTLEFSEGGERSTEVRRPELMLSIEKSSEWKRQFKNEDDTKDFISFGPCTNKHATYDLPVRYTEGDIKVGDRVGEYYKSTPCVGTPTGDRHAWLFRYDDANGNRRGLLIYGLTGGKSFSDFPYFKVRDWISGATW